LFIFFQGLKSGCTAVTVLISDDKMFVAWLGDSQVVLCKGGEFVPLMEPHKPDNQVMQVENID